MSTFVVAVVNSQSSELTSSEFEELVEEAETLSLQCKRRQKNKHSFTELTEFRPTGSPGPIPTSRFFRPLTERDQFNGSGGYLLI